jgi:hypothetical protein
MKKIELKTLPSKIKTRCSSLPSIFKCKPSVVNPDRLVEVEVYQSAAELGTAIHAAIQKAVETGDVDFRKIERTFEDEDIERAKLLFGNGMAVVADVTRHMPNMQFEVEVAFDTDLFSVTGHIDILDVSATRAYVVDFKTGRLHQDHTHQMIGYAVGAWTKMGRPDKYEVHIAYVYLDSNTVTKFTVTAEDMREWIKELDSLPDRYVVSGHCNYCKLNNSCPTYRSYLSGAMTLLTSVAKLPTVDIRKLAPEQRQKLTLSLKAAQVAAERIREHIKEDTIRRGDIDKGDGTTYTIKTRTYRTLLTAKALPIIGSYLSAKEIVKVTTLRLNAVIQAIQGRQIGPMRKVIGDEVMARLEKAGAIVASESKYLESVANEKDNKWQRNKSKSPLKKNSPPPAAVKGSTSRPSKRRKS